MRKKLLIIGTIVASLGLAGCGDNNTGTNNDVNEQTQNDVDKDGSEAETDIEVEENDSVNDSEENIKDKGEDIIDKIEDATMTDEQMIEESEYIVKVKKIEKEKNNFEIKILENLKGNLSAEDIPNADTLEKNRAYLVFLKVQDGGVVPVNDKKSFILLEGDNHEIFEKINKNR